ncbi:hypothetical protein DFH09DRAFT_1170180, partial [Mycena vulgaris]
LAGAAPKPLLARLLLLTPGGTGCPRGPCAPPPAHVALAAPAGGQRGTGWGCSGAARRARPQPEVERARAAVELVLMGQGRVLGLRSSFVCERGRKDDEGGKGEAGTSIAAS